MGLRPTRRSSSHPANAPTGTQASSHRQSASPAKAAPADSPPVITAADSCRGDNFSLFKPRPSIPPSPAATGHPSSVVQGLQMVRRLGRFVEFGVFAQQTTVDWTLIGDNKELDVLGSHLSPYCYPYVIENIANGKLKTEGIVKTFFRLEEWEKAFDYATGKYGDFKIAFRFD